MCGICGIHNFDKSQAVQEALIDSMTNVLEHRGPDDSGSYITGNVGLGFRRLSIIDLETGHQPLHNEDHTISIVFNGEIYNFQEIRKQLKAKGHQFRTNTDTECIVHGYEEWGVRVLDKLRGMYAFAIWDARLSQLFLARDRIGKKPLYYYHDGKRLIFGSEIKAVLRDACVKREINPEALCDYMSLLYVPAPKTIYNNIFKLPPGHWLLSRDGRIQIEQYWDIPFNGAVSDAAEEKVAEDLAGHLKDSVQTRLVSDVPLGAFLSGGLDSSIVVSLMNEQSESNITTSSIGFSEAAYDELAYSRLLAKNLNARHHEYQVTPDAATILPKLAWHLDEPHGDYSVIPTYYVSQMARERVTVALSGDGGDENFAGYTRRYYFDRLENQIRGLLPAPLRRIVFGTMAAVYPKADWLPRALRAKTMLQNIALKPEHGFFNSMSALSQRVKSELFCKDLLHTLADYDSVSVFEDYFSKCASDDPLSRVQYVDMKTYLVDDILMKVDKMSMANSLEVRCPLLDHQLIEYVATLPSSLKLKGKTSKYILKKTASDFIPEEIITRPKQGFNVPISEWLRSGLKDFAGQALFESANVNEYFEAETIRKMWSHHQAGLRDWSSGLWAILMFSLWSEQFLSN